MRDKLQHEIVQLCNKISTICTSQISNNSSSLNKENHERSIAYILDFTSFNRILNSFHGFENMIKQGLSCLIYYVTKLSFSKAQYIAPL